jgi:23S rRNA (cytidine2498-2'-O)-methyltransferase
VALLERGVNVIAVDPGDMDPRVAALAEERGLRFEHLALAAGKLDKSVLPPRIDYLLSDMNLAPPVALRYVSRLVGMLRGSLRGAFLTLKLNDQAMVDALPSFTAKLAELGLGTPRLVQLPSHRQEVAAVLPGVRHSRPPARKRGLARR